MRNSVRGSFTNREGDTGPASAHAIHATFVALVLALALVMADGSAGTNAQAPEPAVQGEWSAPFPTPVAGIHAAVLPTGKVLQYSYPLSPGGSEAWIWDPGTGAFTEVPIDKNIFCGGHASLPDGTLLTVGGTVPSQPDEGPFGLKDLYNFDPVSETWSDPGDTQIGRWYPTTTTLPDGRILILSGFDEAGDLTPVPEVYDPSSGSQVLAGAEKFMSLYPWTHVLPNGAVVHTGPEPTTSVLDVTTPSWSAVATNEYGNRHDGTSVLLPLRPPEYRPQAMVVGGDNPATNTAEVIDFADAIPDWAYTGSLTYARHHANAVLLPNGEVLAVGGTAVENEPTQAVLPAEMFDPSTGVWTEMASMERPRIYHSTAVLLPDGRVLQSGTDFEFTAEIYSPPYLFQGTRPVIDAAPGAVDYGASFMVSTSDQDVATVVLAKTSAVTHSVNMEQRIVELTFQQGVDSLNVQAPPSPNLAPPGYYMMFLLDSDGVPSESTFVRVGATDDNDGDGLPNNEETLLHGTDPMNADSDGDSLSDSDEINVQGTDPLVYDGDDDDLSDGEEVLVYGTDPFAADSDTDLLLDGLEVWCGSLALNASSEPERIDGPFVGVDDDLDTLPDEPLPPGAGGFDCDGDGFTGSAEDHVYSYMGQTDGDQKTCQEYDTNFTAVDPNQTSATPSLRWPLDFNNATMPLDSFNKITILDITSFLVPVKYFGSDVGANPGDVRWDLTPGAGVFSTDINVQDITAMIAGPSGNPPMLGGGKALGGSECPWAP